MIQILAHFATVEVKAAINISEKKMVFVHILPTLLTSLDNCFIDYFFSKSVIHLRINGQSTEGYIKTEGYKHPVNSHNTLRIWFWIAIIWWDLEENPLWDISFGLGI